jgi:hypothetical protein
VIIGKDWGSLLLKRFFVGGCGGDRENRIVPTNGVGRVFANAMKTNTIESNCLQFEAKGNPPPPVFDLEKRPEIIVNESRSL